MTKIGNIKSAVVQRVGNKSKEDGVAFSNNLCQVGGVEEYLLSVIKVSFKFDDWKRFYYIDDLEMNPTYRFVSKIFEDEAAMVTQANNLARHLYEQSIHPNIKIGEFYVVLLEGCEVDGEEANAIGLFKSEVHETVLTVKMENNQLVLSPEMGMSLKKLEKGCIVFNVEKEQGYKVAVVDNTGSNTDAHYWVDNFLHVCNCEDDYHQTERLAELCRGFVEKVSEQSSLNGAIIAKKATEVLKTTEILTVADLADVICQNEEQKDEFKAFRKSFEDENGALNDEVVLVKKAVNYKPVSRMNVLKIGNDFEVKVLNSEARIETGEDESGKWWKLYS